MQDRSYSDLLELIESLAGVDSFTSSEESKILALANRRGYQAYNSYDQWPRFMIAAQARPAPDGYVPRTYNATAGIRTGSAETRDGTTVTIVCTAAVDFVVGQYVTVSGLTGTVDPNGTYQVTGLSETTVENDTFTYTVDTTNTATETYSGTATVTPVAIPDIAYFNRLWDGNPWGTDTATEYEFYVDSDGATPINNFQDLTGFWVAFKKEWDGPYTSNSTTIPLEFFYFMAHGAYADFLRGDGQVDKALAEESVASTWLALEVDKAENTRNNNSVGRRISTYVSRQARAF